MNRSTPGLPVHHHLPEFTQTHVHRVSDAIQPSHPRSSPSPPGPNPSQIRVFSNESTLLMRWPKYWSFSFSIIPSKEISGLISFAVFFNLQRLCLLTGPFSPLKLKVIVDKFVFIAILYLFSHSFYVSSLSLPFPFCVSFVVWWSSLYYTYILFF